MAQARGVMVLLAVGSLVFAVVASVPSSADNAGNSSTSPGGRGFEIAAIEEQNVPPRPAYVGAATCSAVGCHGGSESKPGDASAYRTWRTRDPHARAYAALENSRSRRMAELLAGRDRTPTPPTSDARCLSCHVHPDALDSERAGRLPLSDGVSCESCHGPASRWLEPHWSEWPARSPGAEARMASGMIATSDLATCARTCAGCHVGGAGRDVNHDLIAAGHPALRFEFSAFLANLPRHWDAAKGPTQADGAAHTWAVGQLASARAALELLAWRAGGEQAAAPTPWPELAEYSCFSCHHGLDEPAWLAGRAAAADALGALRWGTWYYAFTPYFDAADAGQADLPLARLAREMNRPDPPRDEVHRLALLASERCETVVKDLGRFDTDRLRALIDRAAQRRVPDWDARAQMFLAASVLAEGAHSAAEERSALRAMFEALQFASGHDSPAPRAKRPADEFVEALTRFLRATRP